MSGMAEARLSPSSGSSLMLKRHPVSPQLTEASMPLLVVILWPGPACLQHHTCQELVVSADEGMYASVDVGAR